MMKLAISIRVTLIGRGKRRQVAAVHRLWGGDRLPRAGEFVMVFADTQATITQFTWTALGTAVLIDAVLPVQAQHFAATLHRLVAHGWEELA